MNRLQDFALTWQPTDEDLSLLTACVASRDASLDRKCGAVMLIGRFMEAVTFDPSTDPAIEARLELLVTDAAKGDPRVRFVEAVATALSLSWTARGVTESKALALLHSTDWVDRLFAAYALAMVANVEDSAMVAALRTLADDPVSEVASWAQFGLDSSD